MASSVTYVIKFCCIGKYVLIWKKYYKVSLNTFEQHFFWQNTGLHNTSTLHINPAELHRIFDMLEEIYQTINLIILLYLKLFFPQ